MVYKTHITTCKARAHTHTQTHTHKIAIVNIMAIVREVQFHKAIFRPPVPAVVKWFSSVRLFLFAAIFGSSVQSIACLVPYFNNSPRREGTGD